MKKYSTLVFVCLAACIVVTKPVTAQTVAETTVVQTIRCARDVGAGGRLRASARYEGVKLVGVDLQLLNRGATALVLAPERVRLYDLLYGQKLLPLAYEVNPSDQSTLVRYSFSGIRATGVGVVFLEDAIKSDSEDIGQRQNLGIPAPTKVEVSVGEDFNMPCLRGPENREPKALRVNRLLAKDKDRGAALEAALETLEICDVADPAELLFAAYWINSAESSKLAMDAFYKAMLRVRFGVQSKLDLAVPYFLASLGPDVANYGSLHVPELIKVLQATLEWDAQTFPQWAAANGTDVKDAGIQRRRQVARKVTLELIEGLKRDPVKFAKDIEKYSVPDFDWVGK
jgi:hypothetical protein